MTDNIRLSIEVSREEQLEVENFCVEQNLSLAKLFKNAFDLYKKSLTESLTRPVEIKKSKKSDKKD